MSVLIKGMKMPKSCRGCKLYHYIEGTGCFSCDVLPGLDDGVELKPWKNRRKDCPLVSVPPHGRLIDADALMVHDGWMNEERGRKTHITFVYSNDIAYAPTIIEAEEGE